VILVVTEFQKERKEKTCCKEVPVQDKQGKPVFKIGGHFRVDPLQGYAVPFPFFRWQIARQV
jgi:hypothetical protein